MKLTVPTMLTLLRILLGILLAALLFATLSNMFVEPSPMT